MIISGIKHMADYPVRKWTQAKAFCAWSTKQNSYIKSRRKVRLINSFLDYQPKQNGVFSKV
jgi:hypothetical protein